MTTHARLPALFGHRYDALAKDAAAAAGPRPTTGRPGEIASSSEKGAAT
jgi:hypothetical protein